MKKIIATLAATLALGSAVAADRIEEIITTQCATCHGAQGQASSPIFPSLAAQNRDYLIKQLKDFKSGKRKSETMTPQVANLSTQDMEGLGTFFASKPAKVHRVADEDLLAVGRYIYMKGNSYSGVPACAGCHGDKGQGSAQLPRLAGQNSRYLLLQLKEFNQRTRSNDNEAMHLVASRLSELESKAVSDYLAQTE